jgi:uncharacterized membrane protein YkoI
MLLTSITAAVLLFSPGTAAVADAIERAPAAVRYAGVSLDQAIQMVQSHYRAKVIKADVGSNDGKRVYLLRVLSPEGRVFAVRVDAETGRMF